MPVRVVHSVRVVVDATLLDRAGGELLAEAVEAGVARAVETSRVRVLDGLPAGTRVEIREPETRWAGAAVANLTADGRTAVEELVAAAIRRAVAAAGVADGALRRDATPVAGPVEEAADQGRLSSPMRRYVVPAYRDGRHTAIEIRDARPAPTPPGPVVRWTTLVDDDYVMGLFTAMEERQLWPDSGLLGALYVRRYGDYGIGAVRFPDQIPLQAFSIGRLEFSRFDESEGAVREFRLDPRQVHHLKWRGSGSDASSIIRAYYRDWYLKRGHELLPRLPGQSPADHEQAVQAAVDERLERRIDAAANATAFLMLTAPGQSALIPVTAQPDWVSEGLDLTLLPIADTVVPEQPAKPPASEEQEPLDDQEDEQGGDAADDAPGGPSSPAPGSDAGSTPAPEDEVARQLQEIDTLPARVRWVLFDTGGWRRPPRPDQYVTVLRIAARLRGMTPADIDDLVARSTGSTTEWAVLEDTVDAFLAEMRDRRAEAEQRELMMVRLHAGLLSIYRTYRQLRGSVSEVVAVLGPLVDAPISGQVARDRAVVQLEADLRAAGFEGIAGFEAVINAWLAAYRTETLALARSLLDRFAHVLDGAERQYRDPAQVAALYRDLAPSRDRVADADRVISEHVSSVSESERAALDSALAGQRLHDAALGRLKDAVVGLAGRHPLLGLPAFPYEELARTPEAGLPAFLSDYITARRGDVRDVREALAATPDLVFKLDELQTAAAREQGIEPGSLYAEIVADRGTDIHLGEALVGLAVAVLAVALGIVAGAGGEAAVGPEAAAVAGAGAAVTTAADLGIGATLATAVADVALSGAMAVADFRRYEVESAAYGTGLLSDDPSFAWVIVSVVGVLASAPAAVKVFREFPALRGIAQTYNRTHDVPALRAELATVAGLELRIAEAVRRAAERAVADEVRSLELLAEWFPTDALRASVGAESLVRVTLAAYRLAARGVRSFEVFLLEVRSTRLLGDLSELGPAERALLEQEYAQGLRLASRVRNHGRRLGLSEDQMEMFLRLWADEPGMTAEQLTVRMDEWVVASGGTPAGFRAAPETREAAGGATSDATAPPETTGEPPTAIPAGTTSAVTDTAEAGPSIFVPDDETVEQWIRMWEGEIEKLTPESEAFAKTKAELERRIMNLRNRRSVRSRLYRGRQSEKEIQHLYSSREKRYHITESADHEHTKPDATFGNEWAVEIKNWNIMYPTEAEMEAVARGGQPSKVTDLIRQVQDRREIFGNRQTVVVDLRGQLRLTRVSPQVHDHNTRLLHAFGRRLAELTGLPVEQIQIVVW